MVGCVLRVCDPLSCELWRVAVELGVHLLCLSLSQVHFVRVYAGVTFIFRGDSTRFPRGLLLVKLVPLGGREAGQSVSSSVQKKVFMLVFLHCLY